MVTDTNTPLGVDGGMSVAENLRAARLRKGWSQEKLAEAAGCTQTTIDKIESGFTLRSRFLPAIANALEVPLSEIDETLGSLPASPLAPSIIRPAPIGLVPVFPAVEGGEGELLVNKEPMDWVPRPEPLARITSGYLVYIGGTSMIPAYRPGEQAIVNDRLPPQPDEVHIFYTDDPADDRAMIKLLVREARREWHVAQYNPEKLFDLDRGEWPKAHRVVGKYTRG